MKALKLLALGFAILLGESIVQGLLVFLIVLFLPIVGYSYKGFYSLFGFTILFLYYKIVVEYWLFLLLTRIRSQKRPLQKKDIFIAKMASTTLMQLLLIGMAFDAFDGAIGIFSVYALSFLPAVALTYLLLKRYLNKTIAWFNTP